MAQLPLLLKSELSVSGSKVEYSPVEQAIRLALEQTDISKPDEMIWLELFLLNSHHGHLPLNIYDGIIIKFGVPNESTI